jgi:hypothetical protein
MRIDIRDINMRADWRESTSPRIRMRATVLLLDAEAHRAAEFTQI